MVQKQGFLMRIRQRLFGNKANETAMELLIEDPEQSFEEEIVHTTDKIDLSEQLQMIRIVDEYTGQFVFPRIVKEPSWDKGFALQNEVFVTLGDEPVYRSNMEVFFQDSKTGERKSVYLVSLVRFADDNWRVFQVKGVMPLLE
ncbi:hypothetical protein SAMN04487897_1172 [Paenibacillus sp. yr247]|uniref:hypothetical protein n=1 Tax=Paenibacillus sp. yr247 TaxID=1761880 RepID=UPI0008916D04|nr:hypothetical protein [Paenibacillus sp. yr247]SDO56793.1 hypothetical protein SAMN04487897_1172 [Paenibacillus sp. yr247]